MSKKKIASMMFVPIIYINTQCEKGSKMLKRAICAALLCLEANSALAADDLKSVNISVQPLGFLIGFANIEADFGVTDTIAIGPSLSYTSVNFLGLNITVLGIGANADFYLGHKRFTDGFFVGTGLGLQIGGGSGSFLGLTSSGSTSATIGVGAEGTIGYAWFWGSGFNLGLEAGAAYSSVLASDSAPSVRPILGFRLGWAF